jgi:hypothetical protein
MTKIYHYSVINKYLIVGKHLEICWNLLLQLFLKTFRGSPCTSRLSKSSQTFELLYQTILNCDFYYQRDNYLLSQMVPKNIDKMNVHRCFIHRVICESALVTFSEQIQILRNYVLVMQNSIKSCLRS